MQNVREVAFVLSCSMLARTIGTILIFAALDGVWYSTTDVAFTASSFFTTIGSLFAAVVGATLIDVVLVGSITKSAMIKRIHKTASLERLGQARVIEEMKRLSQSAHELRKSDKVRLDLVGVSLGVWACLYSTHLSGVTIAMLCVALQLHFINQRLKAVA